MLIPAANFTYMVLSETGICQRRFFSGPERAGGLKYSQAHKRISCKGNEIYVLGNQVLRDSASMFTKAKLLDLRNPLDDWLEYRNSNINSISPNLGE